MNGRIPATHFDFNHTVTDSSLPDYARTYPGAKAGDHLQETRIRTQSGKVIKARSINGRPIPWID